MILEELNVNKEDALFVKIKSIRERLVLELAKRLEERSKLRENRMEIQEFFCEEREKSHEKCKNDEEFVKTKKYFNSFLNQDL